MRAATQLTAAGRDVAIRIGLNQVRFTALRALTGVKPLPRDSGGARP